MNEDPTQYRTRHVERFFRDRLLLDTLRLDVYPIEGWAGRPTGWNLPRLHDGLFTWPICPALIAATTAEMFADDCDDLLLAIIAYVTLYIVHQDVPEEEREAKVRSVFHERYALSMDILINVELASY